ncbi:Adenylyl cyclase-associated protein 1 [Myotis davidii]|uniref:Adenylyl cyclase-associated protein 1 n=1 Tax=Myotis davidii TaxID=225400 RepID=L5LN04_MYODS|nr:Adenylyl cyclase-associated protein 1 [Myotis davidii]
MEIINNRDDRVQVMGKVPGISINKTDGYHDYLGKSSLACEIVPNLEMNVQIPTEAGTLMSPPSLSSTKAY